MFSGLDDDDDDFSLGKPIKSAFSSNEGSNLASLFGGGASNNPSQSLTYTAPKQPRKNTITSADDGKKKGAAVASTVLQAAAVHCYKLIGGQYENVGKVGAALLGAGQSSAEYRILLYVTQQKPVANATVAKGFKFEVLPSRYARFYDDSQTLYSIVFDKQEVLDKFSKQVLLAVSHVSHPLAEVLIQDMQIGEGSDTLQDGDAAELKYTGWLLSAGQLTQVIDSNMDKNKTFALRLGKGKVIKGWEQGIVGMKAQGRRLIAIPPHLGYGEQGVPQRVPSNATLMFEVNLLRMKKEAAPAPPQPTLPPVPQSEMTAEPPSLSLPPVEAAVPTAAHSADSAHSLPVPDAGSVRERTRSVNEQLEHTSTDSSLKNRMAKLGTAMLPMPAFNSQLSADTVQEKQELSPQKQHRAPNTQPTAQTEQSSHYINQSQHPTQNLSQPQPLKQVPIQSAFQPISSSHRPSPSPSPSMVFGNLAARQQMATPDSLQQQMYWQQVMQQQLLQQQQQLLSQHSATPQMWGQSPLAGMNQPMASAPSRGPMSADTGTADNSHTSGEITRKLDNISQQIERLQTTPNNIPTIETRVLLENLTRIIKDSERLKTEITEKSKKIEEQNVKISSLLEDNQRHVEQSNNILEQRNDSYKHTANQSQSKILKLEEEKNELSSKLSTVMSQLTSAQLAVSELRKTEIELRDEVTSLAEKNVEVRTTTETLKTERSKRRETESKLSSLEEEVTELRDTISNLNKTLAERKQRFLEEREQAKQELAEVQSQHSKELSALKNRYQERHHTESNQRVTELEEELEIKWKSKMADALSAANKEKDKLVGEVREEKEVIKSQALKLKEKLVALKELYDEKLEELQSSQEEVEDLSQWKEKFEKLKEYTKSMKENYDGEVDELEEMITNIKQKTRVVFSTLSGLFDSNENYRGADVCKAISATIKGQKAPSFQPLQSQVVEDKVSTKTEVLAQPEVAYKLGENGIENVPKESEVDPEVAHKLGDKGIENVPKESKVDPEVAHKLGDKGIENVPKESKVDPEVAHKLGDKGIENVPKESKVDPEVAHKLGDKGIENVPKESKVDPEVAYKLGDKGIENVPKEAEVDPEVAHKLGDNGIENLPKEAKVDPEVAHKLGDKGIENVPKESKVDPEVAHKLGDKGIENLPKEAKVDPEVAHKLGDKGIENVPKESKVDPEVAHKLGDNGIENVPKESKVDPEVAHKLGDKGIENVPKESKVDPEVAHKLGDKGIENVPKESKVDPEVAHKLGDNGIENVPKEAKVDPEVAHKLGDKGIENVPKESKVDPEVAHKLGEDSNKGDSHASSNTNQQSDQKVGAGEKDAKKNDLFGSDSEDEFVKDLTTPKSPQEAVVKETPPPLFGDDDEEDLDWLS